MSLIPRQASTQLQDFPPDYVSFDQGSIAHVGNTFAFALATAAIALRLCSKQLHKSPIALADWLIIASWPCMVLLFICGIFVVVQGKAGRHLLVVLVEYPDALDRLFLWVFIGEYAYFTVIALIKLSILALYRQTFPTRNMKMSCKVVGAVVLIWCLAVLTTTTVQCQPIRKAWLTSLEEGTCLNKNTFFVANAVPNIVTDVVMLVLPVYEISKLRMKVAKKILLSLIFILGIFVVVISGIRLGKLVELLEAGPEADTTMLFTDVLIWTIIEPAIGTLCACMPTMGPLIRPLFKRFYSDTSKKSSGNSRSFNQVVTIGGSNGRRSKFARLQEEHDETRIEAQDDGDGPRVLSSTTYERGTNDDRDIELTAITHDQGAGSRAWPLATPEREWGGSRVARRGRSGDLASDGRALPGSINVTTDIHWEVQNQEPHMRAA
ncbi:hypothetical protein GGR52DRAFT_593034 [Hypoxylon sp. FL1284]|nr:hypothetical protein GGR52DRAFT_593034 [Hypoxylon sp. FL1284]